MAVAFVQEFKIQGDDRSTTNYDAVNARLNAESDPPEGAIAHTAGFDEEAGVFRIFDVWESREQAQRFVDERVLPIVDELRGGGGSNMTPPDKQYFYDLHDVFAR
jgi:hypothetical protein